ncbi:putative mynd domain protein [Botrytis fragariae]|uniref:Putative mynd domain protein n=1 Tax=Botrytis fragariae TaxID=1964551 RepID=A0A8H6AHJ8_9HELO|nr:putative mynd domain protein [Botrytis fragariae]KAF5867552.1 putative mynd domain protein [Botrytis fragariae]
MIRGYWKLCDKHSESSRLESIMQKTSTYASCEDPRMLGTHIQDFDREGSKFQYCAEREVKKGEEVCLSYIEVPSRSKMKRRHALARWLSGDCRCKRCLAE